MFKKLHTKLLKKTALISYFLLTSFNNYAAFLEDQLRHERVKQAYDEKLDLVTSKLDSQQLKITDFEVMFKIYKYEQELKVYVRKKTAVQWSLLYGVDFCASSGTLGPKIKQWDGQIPEGYYHIHDFNPYSSFLLSMGVSYPNAADKLRFPADHKGDGIYIHGGCATIGCIPVEDEPIKELYLLAVLAKNNGQNQVPVHIFPFSYSAEKMRVAVDHFPAHAAFWKDLFAVEQNFDTTFIQPAVGINKTGKYYVK